MLYKGRKVEYLRDAAKNDPYYDADYNQVIVVYTDTLDRETVKEDQLDGWDAKERKGTVSDTEKKQDAALVDARKQADKDLPHGEEVNVIKASKK